MSAQAQTPNSKSVGKSSTTSEKPILFMLTSPIGSAYIGSSTSAMVFFSIAAVVVSAFVVDSIFVVGCVDIGSSPI